MAQSHGCWQEASVPHHMGLSLGLLEYPRNMAAGFPPEQVVPESKEEEKDSTPFQS